MRVLAPAKHVLVIDDAEELRTLFRDILTEEGCRVSLAAAAPNVGEIAALAPDLIVLDLLLGTDEDAAWRLLQQLRRDERLAAVPVIVCSAATQMLARRKASLGALAAEVVPKPFDLDDLLGAVARCLAPTPGAAPCPPSDR